MDNHIVRARYDPGGGDGMVSSTNRKSSWVTDPMGRRLSNQRKHSPSIAGGDCSAMIYGTLSVRINVPSATILDLLGLSEPERLIVDARAERN